MNINGKIYKCEKYLKTSIGKIQHEGMKEIFSLFCKLFPDHPDEDNVNLYLIKSNLYEGYNLLFSCEHFEHGNINDLPKLNIIMEMFNVYQELYSQSHIIKWDLWAEEILLEFTDINDIRLFEALILNNIWIKDDENNTLEGEGEETMKKPIKPIPIAQVGDTIEFKWVWWQNQIIRKGVVEKVYENTINIFTEKYGEQFYHVDCSAFQPTHSAFVSEFLILSVNGVPVRRDENATKM